MPISDVELKTRLDFKTVFGGFDRHCLRFCLRPRIKKYFTDSCNTLVKYKKHS